MSASNWPLIAVLRRWRLIPVADAKVADEIKKASELAKVPIHSVMNSDHWKFPLSSPDAEVVAKCRAGMETSIRNAKLWGAETVLLVPAVVDAKTSYAEAYQRSQAEIRKLIPLAAESKVVIAVEEVWNKFLTSPLEFARYIDEFKSPWVRAYFDVGNVVLFGYPQDWIRTLGPRIAKVHIKDFRFKSTPASRGQECGRLLSAGRRADPIGRRCTRPLPRWATRERRRWNCRAGTRRI